MKTDIYKKSMQSIIASDKYNLLRDKESKLQYFIKSTVYSDFINQNFLI